MEPRQDERGNWYVDVLTASDQHVRVTLVPGERAGYGDVSVRIQIRDETGHLRQGPEILLDTLGDVFKAIMLLVRL
jgi:hypothetical protein